MAQANEPEATAPFFSLMALSEEERDEQWMLGCVTTDHALASRGTSCWFPTWCFCEKALL